MLLQQRVCDLVLYCRLLREEVKEESLQGVQNEPCGKTD